MFDDFLMPSLSLDSFSYPGMTDDELDYRVKQCIDDMQKSYGNSISDLNFEDELGEWGLVYNKLPRYYQKQFDDKFNIYNVDLYQFT